MLLILRAKGKYQATKNAKGAHITIKVGHTRKGIDTANVWSTCTNQCPRYSPLESELELELDSSKNESWNWSWSCKTMSHLNIMVADKQIPCFPFPRSSWKEKAFGNHLSFRKNLWTNDTAWRRHNTQPWHKVSTKIEFHQTRIVSYRIGA